MGKRQYSDNDKAAALAALDANGGNVNQTASQLGVPRKTLEDWHKGRAVNTDVAEIRQDKKEELADVFERVARKYLAHAESDTVVTDASGKDAIVSAATAVDKMRLLRNLPTEIVQVIPQIQEIYLLLQSHGKDPAAVFNAMIAKLHAERTN